MLVLPARRGRILFVPKTVVPCDVRVSDVSIRGATIPCYVESCEHVFVCSFDVQSDREYIGTTLALCLRGVWTARGGGGGGRLAGSTRAVPARRRLMQGTLISGNTRPETVRALLGWREILQ